MNSIYAPPIYYPVVLTGTLAYSPSGSSGYVKRVTANQYATIPSEWVDNPGSTRPNYFTTFTRIATGNVSCLIAGYEPDETSNKIAIRIRNQSTSALSNLTVTVDYQTPAIR